MNESCDRIKTLLAEPKKFSALAQLVALHIANGTLSTKTIAELTGYSDRAVRKAKAELECRPSGTIVPGEAEPEFRAGRNPGAAKRNQSAAENPPYIPPCNSSRVDTPNPTSQSAAHEIEGLNGSTNRLAGQLAGYLAGDFHAPDLDVARRILQSNVEAYGPIKVKIGMLELETLIASNGKPRDVLKAFNGFIKNAKPPRADTVPKKSYIEQKQDLYAAATAVLSMDMEASS